MTRPLKGGPGVTYMTLLMIAVVAVIAFLLVISSAPFKDKMLSQMYPKPTSLAAENKSFTLPQAASGDLFGRVNNRPGKIIKFPTNKILSDFRKAQNLSSSTPLGSGNLTYNNGPTERTGSTEYLIFWLPTGSTVSPSYQSLITRYFNDVGGSGYYNTSVQYYDTTGNIMNSSRLGGTWTDNSAYPSSSLTGQDIADEATKAIIANNWPLTGNVEYFVYTAEDEGQCLDSTDCALQQFCAWHSYMVDNFNDFIPLAYVSYPTDSSGSIACKVPNSTFIQVSPNNFVGTSANHDSDADSAINASAHEQMETVTDIYGTAWYDIDGYEIADKCAYTFGPFDSTGADVYLNNNPYEIQELYSNNGSACVMTYGSVSTPSPTPTPSQTPTPTPSPTFQPTASPSACPTKTGDFNNDGSVNLTDLSIFASSYGTTSPNIPNPCTDLNQDGSVNLTDLSIFAAGYGT